MNDKNTCTEFHRRIRGFVVPMALFILFIIMIIGFSVYNYSKFERGVVIRFRFASVADKMAKTAAMETANWYNYKILIIKSLKPDNALDRFVLATISEKSINGLTISLSSAELKSFGIIESLNGKLESAELKYESFAKYFSDPKIPPDYSRGCVLVPDPFERYGLLTISTKVIYMNIQRTYTCTYEMKISNTLVPVISKFTLFTRDRDGASENQVAMSQPVGETDIGGQGIIDNASKPLRAPLILVHHPDDVETISGFKKNMTEMREYLPLDKSVNAATSSSYRPLIHNRGWVFLGCENPDSCYVFNVAPGKPNPDSILPYAANLCNRYYGNGFQLLETDLCALIIGSLKGKFPFNYSFSEVKKPEGLSDYIIRLTQTGIYWILKTPAARPIIGNFTENNQKFTTDSALIQLSGDIQTLGFSSEAGKPSKYLDRRSPTVVFGKVGRSFVQVGNLAQNCQHPQGSGNAAHNAKYMQPNGMHSLPYVNPPTHPRTTFLPFFNISEEGMNGQNPVFDFDDAKWGGFRVVDDNLWQTDTDFAKVKYDVNSDIFNLGGTNQMKNYRFFMTQVINEVYNKTYNWIVANSKPHGGAIEPGERYYLKQNEIKILSSYPDSQLDTIFFYGNNKDNGNVFAANRLKIMQYKDTEGSIRSSDAIFEDGIFRGNLNALSLSAANYQNPYRVDGVAKFEDYDIRQKSNYIFTTFAEFEKYLLVAEGDSLVLKEGGVFYIDAEAAADFTKSSAVKKLVFHENAMIICRGTIRLPEVAKSVYAVNEKATLSFVSIVGDVVIAGKNIEASLNSLNGTIRKEVDYFQVFGNVTMNRLYFNLSEKGNLFKVSALPDSPSSQVLGKNNAKGFERNSVMYDPDMDMCNQVAYSNHYKVFVSTRPAFWKLTSEE